MPEIQAPYHPGEIDVQSRAGETRIAERNGKVIADKIIDGALKFIRQQRWLMLAHLDSEMRPWASPVLLKLPALEASPEEVRIPIKSIANEGLLERLGEGQRVFGALFIEPSTRRRFRLNGEFTFDETTLALKALEAYPNCPKYIQKRRDPGFDEPASAFKEISSSFELSMSDQALIESSQTLYIASSNGNSGLDASHRGGPQGFVCAINETELLFPDYPGNSMFNTLGNISLSPKVGISFIEPSQGTLLELTGSAEILWDREEDLEASAGSARWVRFRADRVRRYALPRSSAWHVIEASPHNPAGK